MYKYIYFKLSTYNLDTFLTICKVSSFNALLLSVTGWFSITASKK